jgi:protein-S-isoprenylcysteine O-methyltransferase Ste14
MESKTDTRWTKAQRLFFIREWTFNILVAMYFFYFAANHIRDYSAYESMSILLFISYESLIVLLALARRMPKDVSFRSMDWIAAGIGTYLPLMFRSPGASPYAGGVFLYMQFVGICFSFAAMFSLNRCFGIVPSNRGVKTGGLYRLVRHPVYTGYFISLSCYVFQNNSWRNYTLLLITLVAQVVRIHMEERVLMKDPAYQDFAKKTKWRLFPGIW